VSRLLFHGAKPCADTRAVASCSARFNFMMNIMTITRLDGKYREDSHKGAGVWPMCGRCVADACSREKSHERNREKKRASNRDIRRKRWIIVLPRGGFNFGHFHLHACTHTGANVHSFYSVHFIYREKISLMMPSLSKIIIYRSAFNYITCLLSGESIRYYFFNFHMYISI